ncbi:hypothetical protein DdX_17314 [Ditylenchus destructor]|uniref:Uncharacterized protein n=1 Tax=Ditylenchus destructor TaxID=166010 RepID=A0AAD4MN73_9BILA|nr:hypothetical protein DdX_17314 [Ditylenchus destructor]
MNLKASHFSEHSVFENLSSMNRSTLLLFLCVFALSEVLLAAKKARIRGVVGVKNSSRVRFVRSACVTDDQCDKMCKLGGASGGTVSDINGAHCDCDGEMNPETKDTCAIGCALLGVGGGELFSEDCICNACQ